MENNAANHVVWAIIIGAIIIAGAILYKNNDRYQFVSAGGGSNFWIMNTNTGEIFSMSGSKGNFKSP